VIRAILVLVFLGPYTILASLLGYPLARLLGSPRVLYGLAHWGVKAACRLAGIRVLFEGTDHLRAPRNVIVMPNHQSHLDAALLFGLLHVEFKAVVKKELYRFPFLHYCLDYAGFIGIDRSDPIRSKRAIARAVESLKAGSCFVIFPEGTRSRTGELGPLKKGGFVVAIDAASRIIPVAILGTRPLMPRGGFRICPGTVRVRVLDPIDAASYSYEERERLIGDVRGRIAAALAG
jgi:1-acyl-sn-glycerol-3-phosphate acyltransferase